MGIVSNAMIAAFCIVIAVVGVRLAKVFRKWLEEDEHDFGGAMGLGVSAIGVLVSAGVAGESILLMCKAIFAPRVYLIEELSKLVK